MIDLRPALRALALLSMGLALLLAGAATADDWPAWRGPERDGICKETGLLKQWPQGGPPLEWKTNGLGEGYSGPAVVGNLLFTMGNLEGKECVIALDWTKKGRQAWITPIGPIRHQGGGYPGPRATPTLDEGRLYTLGAAGNLVCLDAKTGKPVWGVDLVRDLGGGAPNWGYSESVLVDGPWVVCTPGGPRATIAALDKKSGRPVWGAPVGDPAGYSSVVKASIGRVKQYVTLTAKGLIGVSAKDGQPLWRYDKVANGTANIPTPVWYGQTIFGASGYGTGGALIWPKKTGREFQVEEMYFTRQMKNHHGGLIHFDGCLYGADDPGSLTCLDYKTGKVLWEERAPGKCSILFADGMLYCRSEAGPVTLVEAGKKFALKGRFEQPNRSDKNAWPHPVIANGRLFLRDQDVLLCYDVRATK